MKQRLMLDTALNYDIAKEELELIRINLHNKINSWLCNFIVFTANAIEMKIDGREIKSWNDYVAFIQYHVNCKEDAMMILKSAYISFQHCADWKFHMTLALCKELNYALIKKPGIKSNGNFIEKIITYRQNELRKQICRQSGKFNGYTYRVIRACNNDKSNTMQRNYPKYFHEWMLQYKEPTYIEKKKGRPFGPGNKSRGLGPYNNTNTNKSNNAKMTNKNTAKMTRKENMADIAVQEDEIKRKRLLLASIPEDEDDDNDTSKYNSISLFYIKINLLY